MIRIVVANSDTDRIFTALKKEGLDVKIIKPGSLSVKESGKVKDWGTPLILTTEILDNIDYPALRHILSWSSGISVTTDGCYEPHDQGFNKEIIRFIEYKGNKDKKWLK